MTCSALKIDRVLTVTLRAPSLKRIIDIKVCQTDKLHIPSDATMAEPVAYFELIELDETEPGAELVELDKTDPGAGVDELG